MILQRTPAALLRLFIARPWASDDDCNGPANGPALTERVLPTGLMHVVGRLIDRPLYVRDPSAPARLAVPPCLVGVARSGYHARESAAPSSSVGAELSPGAAALLFGAGADELAQRHTSLQELRGSQADRLRAELCELRTAEARLAPNTCLQVRRFQRTLHAMRLDPATPLANVAAAAGCSDPSHFGREFMAIAGVAPAGYRTMSPSEANHLPVAA